MNQAFLKLYQKLLTICYFGRGRVKTSIPWPFFGTSLCSAGKLYWRNWAWWLFYVCVALFSFFSLQLVPPGSRTRTKKSRSDEYDRIFLTLGWQLSGPIIRNERMDWTKIYALFSALARTAVWYLGGGMGYARSWMGGLNWIACWPLPDLHCFMRLYIGLPLAGKD